MQKLLKTNGWMVVLILIFILGLALTCLLPFPDVEKQIIFTLLDPRSSPEDLPADLPDFLFDPQAKLMLYHPQKIWLHEEGAVKVNITLPVTNNEQTASLYEKYNYYYEVRMNLDSVQLLSGDTIFAPIRPGQQSQFQWDIIPVRSGNITGNIWIYIHITDAAVSSQWQITRFALPLRFQVVNFLGLSLRTLRTLLFLGLLLSVFMLMGLSLFGFLRKKPG
jgi:hypothetical protein